MTMTGDQPAADQDEFRRESPDGWGAASVPALVDDTVLRDAVANQVLSLIAATINFLMLSPYTWLHGRTTAEERADVRAVVARLITLRAADIEERCPLCSHAECVDGCPVSVARGIVTRAGRRQ